MEFTWGLPWRNGAIGILGLCYYALFGTTTDAYLLGFWLVLKRWQGAQDVLPFFNGYVGDNAITLSVIAASLAALLLWFRGYSDSDETSKDLPGPLKPLLFPCRTTHTRFFPKKHSFAYSYLMVGVPIGWEGVAGDMIATGPPSAARKGWYQIHAADYLERGNGHLGLRGKLDLYLKSLGVEPSLYPYAYLVTAAKFLGYHFNPVSFWYLYSAEKDMSAMILEVNNTFGERRMYFLTSNDSTTSKMDKSGMEQGKDAAKNEVNKSTTTMRRAWPKDFHVSPFNSRKGGYSLVAHDPFAPMLEGSGLINNTINLTSSKSHAKLVARIFSMGDAIDPESMTTWNKLGFLAAWWWVGFVTFPRIVKEAGLLFFKRQLHVWYRPEPLKESMGRQATETERQLEPIFRRYLRYLVSQSPAPLLVKYVPSGIADTTMETMRSLSAQDETSSTDILEFKVLTPVFYTRFAYYAHDLEALFCELNDNCTIWISRPDLLPKLLFKKPPPTLTIQNPFEFGYFKLIQRLRKRPQRIERPLTSSQAAVQPPPTHSKTDIRDFRLSSMDGYVLDHEAANDRKLYRSLILKLFIADRIAMGSEELLWLEHLLLRVTLARLVVP